MGKGDALRRGGEVEGVGVVAQVVQVVNDGGFVEFVGGGGCGWGGGLVEGPGFVGVDALVDFDDLRGEGFGGEVDFLVVGDFAEGAVWWILDCGYGIGR